MVATSEETHAQCLLVLYERGAPSLEEVAAATGMGVRNANTIEKNTLSSSFSAGETGFY